MPFLLILSALLTALTGVVTGVRPVDVQIARQADTADVARVTATAMPAVAGHAHLLGAFGVTAPFGLARTASTAAAAAPRLYLDRLRA